MNITRYNTSLSKLKQSKVVRYHTKETVEHS